jgi:butyryl-CoA:acetate CoA-transferase
MGNFAEQYRSKLRTADEAVKVVKSGDWVYYSHFAMAPRALDEALAKRAGELSGVMVRGVATPWQPKITEVDPDKKSFIYHSAFFSGSDRKTGDNGLCYYLPSNYNEEPKHIRNDNAYPPQVAMIMTTTMDNNGYFNFGTSCSYIMSVCEKADIIIVQANDQIPRCLGGEQESIHISQVDYIVEASGPQPHIPDIPVSESDRKIARLIIDQLRDGDCLQFGIGGLPNTVGKLIGESNLKNLGIHSEMMSDCFLDLYEKGIVNGSKKNIDKYKMTYTFALGSQRLFDFMNNNPACATFPVDITNTSERIAMNDNMVSINNAVEIDLYGQVSSESSGTRQISGTGGQLDFVIGANKSRGGRAFICLGSTKRKDGQTVSRIVPSICSSIVTVPRNFTPRIVTEYGIVNPMGKSTWRRAEMFIEIAHPDFRDDLIKAAVEQGIWTRTNRIE